LNTGLLLEKAFPATAYIETNTPLPTASYHAVAKLLAGAWRGDAETNLLEAEALINAGAPPRAVVPEVEYALANSPLSARGWIILASLWTDTDRQKAAEALTLAYNLAPREYYLAFPTLLVGAPLWATLPKPVQDGLILDVQGLISDPNRRGQLRLLLGRRGGGELVGHAFVGRPEALRELNRELAQQRLGF
jgi:hypothetical protein